MRVTAYILIFILPCAIAAQDTTVAINKCSFTKTMADSLYIANNYQSAINAYENIIESQGVNAEIYYNLGNAYYKENNIAKAILNYERALQLAPSDSDIKFNLELARNKTIDKELEPYEIFFMQWIKNIINILSINMWAITAIISFLLLLASILFFLFTSKIEIRRGAFIIALTTFIITIFSNIAATHHYLAITKKEIAIVMQPSVTAKSTPDASGTDLFLIHEGRRVKISDDSMNSWKEIELEDGTKGWVPTSTIEKI